jgi:carbohydrate-binding DOMON domain-containing protein
MIFADAGFGSTTTDAIKTALIQQIEALQAIMDSAASTQAQKAAALPQLIKASANLAKIGGTLPATATRTSTATSTTTATTTTPITTVPLTPVATSTPDFFTAHSTAIALGAAAVLTGVVSYMVIRRRSKR